MARAEVQRVQDHRDRVLSEGRREVGIWSSYGVQDRERPNPKQWLLYVAVSFAKTIRNTFWFRFLGSRPSE